MKSDRAEQNHSQHQRKKQPLEIYEILVQGQLDTLWKRWFEGMTLSSVENGENGVACTLIAGPVADQAALHGLLIKIRDLNMELLSVRRVSSGDMSHGSSTRHTDQEDERYG